MFIPLPIPYPIFYTHTRSVYTLPLPVWIRYPLIITLPLPDLLLALIPDSKFEFKIDYFCYIFP